MNGSVWTFHVTVCFRVPQMVRGNGNNLGLVLYPLSRQMDGFHPDLLRKGFVLFLVRLI